MLPNTRPEGRGTAEMLILLFEAIKQFYYRPPDTYSSNGRTDGPDISRRAPPKPDRPIS